MFAIVQRSPTKIQTACWWKLHFNCFVFLWFIRCFSKSEMSLMLRHKTQRELFRREPECWHVHCVRVWHGLKMAQLLWGKYWGYTSTQQSVHSHWRNAGAPRLCRARTPQRPKPHLTTATPHIFSATWKSEEITLFLKWHLKLLNNEKHAMIYALSTRSCYVSINC